LGDLKEYYKKLGPENTSFHLVGNINKAQAERALQSLEKKWKGPKIPFPKPNFNTADIAGNLYFIDVPNAKQSVLLVGKLAVPATDRAANRIGFSNEILGGGSSGRLFQTLRIEKGYTYGASSRLLGRKVKAPFYINSSVRANATLPSLQIIENMLKNYGPGFTQKEVELTKNKVIKRNTRAFESFNAKLGLLNSISKYGKPLDFIEKDQNVLLNMKLEDFKKTIAQHITEEDMVYLVVGDKATQMEEVKKLGKPVIELDIYGNPVR
ncbi:MAG: M16 family metallopeptidase, partial [Marinirhabdus sp.]